MEISWNKFKGEARTILSRTLQFTEEKLGTSEKTELDAHFENLAQRSDATKLWTEKILHDMEAVLNTNPGNPVENFLFSKIERRKPNRLTNMENMGLDMIEAGNEFGPGTAYGSALIRVGQCQQRLGQIQKEFSEAANLSYTQPLQKFLDGEMKTIMKERNILEDKRLDLDVCKNRVRNTRSMQGQQTAENDLRLAQSDFDRQAEITKLLLEGISSTHASHLRCLNEFVETQVRFTAQCYQQMQDLQRELASLSLNSPGAALYQTLSPESLDHNDTSKNGKRRARVLYDYDAKDKTELSLMKDEVIIITEDPTLDPDYVIGERGNQKGNIPRAFLEFLN